MNVGRFALATAMVGTITASALAGTVDVEFTGTGLGRAVRTHFADRALNVFAGQLRHTFSNGTGQGSALDGDYLTYCTELVQYVVSHPSPYECALLEDVPNTSPMGPDRAQAIRDLYAHADGSQFAAVGSSANKDFAAAFQIAVWEAAYDYDGSAGSLDVVGGDLRVTGTGGGPLSAGISGYLDDLFGAVGTGAEVPHLIAVTSEQYQDQIVMIPLPAPLIIGAVGLAAVIWRQRKLARSGA